MLNLIKPKTINFVVDSTINREAEFHIPGYRPHALLDAQCSQRVQVTRVNDDGSFAISVTKKGKPTLCKVFAIIEMARI